MRILFISEYFYPRLAGGEIWSWDLCRGLIKAGHEVTVITSKNDYYYSDIVDRINILRIGYTGKTFNERRQFMNKLEKYLKDCLNHGQKNNVFDFDIIHIMGYIPILPVLKANKKFKKKVVVSLHSYMGKEWYMIKSKISALLNWMLEDFLIHLTSNYKTHVPSLLMKNKIKRKNIIVIPNYIDVKYINKVTKNIKKDYIIKKYHVGKYQDVFCAVGSLQKIKRFDKLIEAMRYTHNDYLIIVGGGEEQKHLQDLIYKYKLEDRIFLLRKKSREETLKIMKACDYFISSSKCESFSYVMAEAYVLGKPILSTPTGIAEELKEQNHNQIQIHNDLRELVCNYKGLAKERKVKIKHKNQKKYIEDFVKQIYD